MSDELATAKRRIYALLQKTVENGASEGEAMLAMNKAGQLLLQFNLSMDEVQLRAETCTTQYFGKTKGGKNSLWYCFSGIQKLCGVKVWISKDREGYPWAFFGLESDVAMAIYLCDLITKSERASLIEYQKTPHYLDYTGHRKTASNNFVAGFGQRINTRLETMAREAFETEKRAQEHTQKEMSSRMVTADATAYTNAPTGSALICLAKQEKIENEFKRLNMKLRANKSRSKARFDYNARNQGAIAGSKVNLSRPINTDIGGNSGLLR